MPDPITTIVIKGTGPGGVTPVADGVVAVTPNHHADIVVQAISPIAALAIRFANAYLTTLVGLVTAGLSTTVIPYHDFADLVWKCAGMSLAGPTISLMKDLLTIFGRLENKYPLATGNV